MSDSHVRLVRAREGLRLWLTTFGSAPQVVPAGYYFVLGDHRNNSSDSRIWGFVLRKYIIAKVQVRWWPISTAKMF